MVLDVIGGITGVIFHIPIILAHLRLAQKCAAFIPSLKRLEYSVAYK